jgi:hypothetical protein
VIHPNESKCLITALNLEKLKPQKLRDFQTKSAHFVWIELKDPGQIPLSSPLFDLPIISESDIFRGGYRLKYPFMT